MPLDNNNNNHNLPGLYDKEAIFSIDNEAIQKCICDSVRENHIDVMLITDPDYGKRHQETIVFTVAKALFDNPSLRSQLFPEWVERYEDIMDYLKKNDVQPKIVNEYIQLTITSYLQGQNKFGKPYLFNYIAGRLAKAISARLGEFTIILSSSKTDMSSESIKIKKKLLEDIEWEPALSAYIYDHLLTLPCVKLFKQFIAQSGCADVNQKLSEMIYESFEYAGIKEYRQSILKTLDNIRKTQKARRSLGPTHYHKTRIEFTALGGHLGSKSTDPDNPDELVDVIPKLHEPVLETKVKKTTEPAETAEQRRKRKSTLKGITPLYISEDIKPASEIELTEEEIFDVQPMEDGKPLAAVIEAGDEDWEETTIPQRGSIRKNGDSVDTSKVSGEITPAPEPETPAPATEPPVQEEPEQAATITLPELPSLAIETPPKEALDKRIADIRGTVKNNPLTLIAGTLAACAVVLGTYVLTRPVQKMQKKPAEKIALIEKTSDAAAGEALKAMKPAVMPDASIEAMRASLPPEVMQADMDVMATRPASAPGIKIDKPDPKQYKPAPPVAAKVDLSSDVKENPGLSPITLSSIRDLKDSTYKNMFAGESYSVDKSKEGSITGFMQEALLEMAALSPNKKEARKSYFRMLRDLEKGWLLYMQIMEHELKNKSELSQKEAHQLEYWRGYKRTHRNKGYDAQYLHNRFKKLKENSREYSYYKNLLEKGTALMKGLEQLNPDILDVNAPGSQRVVYAQAGKSGEVVVLKTFLDFASGMNMPVPAKFTGSTGDITPAGRTFPETTFAETEQKDSTMDLLDRITASVEKDAAEREAIQTAQHEKTDKILDKILVQIEENNHQRDMEKRKSWAIRETSTTASGEIVTHSNLSRSASGEIITESNLSKTASGTIEKPVSASGTIITSESADRLSKTVSGVIEQPAEKEEKKSFFARAKEKAKGLWGRMFG